MKTIQLKSIPMAEQSASEVDGTEGARRATGVPSTVSDLAKPKSLPPDPEVPEKKPRRRFTTAYKLRLGLSQAWMAKSFGVSQRSVRQWIGEKVQKKMYYMLIDKKQLINGRTSPSSPLRIQVDKVIAARQEIKEKFHVGAGEKAADFFKDRGLDLLKLLAGALTVKDDVMKAFLRETELYEEDQYIADKMSMVIGDAIDYDDFSHRGGGQVK